MEQIVTAYTDGAASGNPGPAGWAVLLDGELFSDWLPHATNNQMELFAVQQAIEHCSGNCHIQVTTDSKLVVGLYALGWKTKHEYLTTIVRVALDIAKLKDITLSFKRVKGHSIDAGNLRVDKAAHAQTKIARNALASH